ncbi:hypothetical protein FNF29_01329 [Cafeteria roenbergensis]|nr:hypothetical protein FNF29_01329 [Cafeteria roenbergensis]|eukprot:KAA0155910.1 hypothetical protein FNF29_01329 [Cafeteria roenbergensis]
MFGAVAAAAAGSVAACEAEEESPELASMAIFSGNANPDLAALIAEHVGKPLGSATVGRFPDGEVSVSVHENVRGKDIYIIQPTCPPHVNEYLVELLLMVTTMRRASAEKITVVVPYYGYARQDRKMTSRVPISAADIARLLESVGVDRVVALDLHCGQIQGFFGPRVPVDNLAAARVGVNYFARKVDLENPVIVSPDAGGVYRAKVFREGLNLQTGSDAGLAMIVKQRPRAGVVGQMDLVGEVTGCDCIIVDDMIDTAGTLCKAADLLRAKGARRVYCFASHGLFSGPAVQRISKSCLEKVVVVNTIPLASNAKTCDKIEQLSVAPILGDAIKRIHMRKSVSAMFSGKKVVAAASPAAERA